MNSLGGVCDDWREVRMTPDRALGLETHELTPEMYSKAEFSPQAFNIC